MADLPPDALDCGSSHSSWTRGPPGLACCAIKRIKQLSTSCSNVRTEPRNGGSYLVGWVSRTSHRAWESLPEWWSRLWSLLPKTRRTGFDSALFALTAWHLWKERNAWLFRQVEATPMQPLRLIKQEGDDWISAGAHRLGCLFSE